ncbi:MAG TPA: Gfo/Idh/MocA family oxidoreductase [Prolixibacteraceae bacterium]|jgi:predicted dehydrogenase
MDRKQFLTHFALAGTAAMMIPTLAKANVFGFGKDQKIRIGIIGCGSVSGVYLPHLTNSPYVEVVSVCDIKPERARKRAEEFKVPNQYPHIDQLLAGADFDLMVNLTNMQEHGRLNKQALLKGKHIWSEKPLANSYKEGFELLQLAKKQQVRIWGAPAVVNSPQFAFMAQQIKDGKLGTVAAAHAHYGHLGPTWSAFFYEELGGSLPDLGVYNLTTLSGLLGPVKSVMAMTNILTHERTVDDKGLIKVEAEDNASVLMEHASGAISHVMCGFNYFDPYGHQGTGQDKPTISIVGTKGAMHLIGYDWMPFAVEMATIDHEKPERFATDAGTYVWQEGASEICKSLVVGYDPLINVEHSLHVLEIIEAARKSQQEGKRIALESAFPYPVIKS